MSRSRRSRRSASPLSAWPFLMVAGVLGMVMLPEYALAIGIATGVLIAALILIQERNRKARRLAWMNRQQSMEDLRRLSWQDFERLVCEAYRRQGWKPTIEGGGGADGGIDVRLQRGGRTRLVQCKHWKGRLGIKPVREMMGLLAHHNAERGILVATHGFTKECWTFVRGKPLDLVDGKRLLDLIAESRPSKGGV